MGSPLVRDVRGAGKCIESLMCLVLAQLKPRRGTSNNYLFRHHARDKAATVCRLPGMALCGFEAPNKPSGESFKERMEVWERKDCVDRLARRHGEAQTSHFSGY